MPSMVSGGRGRSVLSHVALDLPGADSFDVLLPFAALGVDVPLVDVFTQRIADHAVLFQVVEGLVEIARQIVDAVLATFAVAHASDVLVDGIARIDLLLDSRQAGSELRGDGEVGIGRRTGQAILAASAVTPLRRDADERRDVLSRPRH